RVVLPSFPLFLPLSMEFDEPVDACNTAEKIGFDDLNAQVDMLDKLVQEWNLDRPPMYPLEDNLSMLTVVAPLSDADSATTMEETTLRTARSGPKARPRQTRSMYVIDEEPALTGRPGKELENDTEAKSMYVMDKSTPLLTFEAIEAKSEYFWQEEVVHGNPNETKEAMMREQFDDKIPFTARNVTSANVAHSAIDHQTAVDRERLFNLLMAYQNLSQTNLAKK
ncbi:hypothetical protein PMAYCL1PPCAC_13041, partial [Pristionchus mayeri]